MFVVGLICIILHILWPTFSFLQFILPAVTLASDKLFLLQASPERSESEHIEASILSWKQKAKKQTKKLFLLCMIVTPNLPFCFWFFFQHPPIGQTMVLLHCWRITRRLLKARAPSEALSKPPHSHDKCLCCHHTCSIKMLFVNNRES